MLHRVNGIYVHPKIAIIFDHGRLGLENKLFLTEKNPVAHLYTILVFYKVNWTARNIILCYKGRL